MTVAAPSGVVWDALMDADLMEVGRRRPLVGALGALRILPEVLQRLVQGEAPEAPPERMTLRDTAGGAPGDGSWVLLAEEPGRALALGLTGRFWKPVIEWAAVPAEAFGAFAEPGFAKTVYALEAVPLDGGRTRLSGTMRTATTDEHARRWFRRYWTLGVGPGAHLLVGALLETARDAAEARVATAAAA